eukprot:gene4049-4394_t
METAGGGEDIHMDPSELMGARWMAPAEIESRVVSPSSASFDGKVSETNWAVIQQALHGPVITGKRVQTSLRLAKMPMLYMAEAAAQ